MKLIKSIALAITLSLFTTNVPAEEYVQVSQEQICDFFAKDALELAAIYATSGKGKEDLAAFLRDRLEKMPELAVFLPGDLLIIKMVLEFTPEELMEDDYIVIFGLVANETCMESIELVPHLWVQEVPGVSKIVREPVSEKVQI